MSKNEGKMDFSAISIVLNLFKQIIKWRETYIISDEVEFHWNALHLSIVQDYSLNLCMTCDLSELRFARFFNGAFWYSGPGSSTIRAKIAASFTQELQKFFMVPRLNKFHLSQNRIKKYQLVEAFLSFLLQLLYHKTDSIDHICGGRIDNLEKELRFLLTILGHTSLILCDDEHEEFQKLLAEFEAVTNEAGILVHSLFFSTDPGFEKMDEGHGVILNHIDSLKDNIMKFLNLLPSIRRSAYITPKTSVVDSLLIVDSLIYDLEDLMKQEDNRIADVEDQIKILHQGLNFLQSLIKDIGTPKPSEIGELKEPLMRIGDMAREAEYLIISFLVGDAPLWYLINRLTDVNHKINLAGIEILEITKKYTFGGLRAAQYFSKQLSLQDKRNTEVDNGTVGFEDKETYLLDKLIGGTESLQVISIFGMPGLGKTTLAKKLFYHPSVNDWFDKLSWCVVSQSYSRQSLLTSILIHIASDLGKDRILGMEEESLIEHIYKTLKRRRFLIVMDDIWDSIIWDELLRCFPDDGNGSRILFTTRNKDVSPPNSIFYLLPSLSKDQCWELLEKKVFDNKPCPLELLQIGKEIAANCCGLPLTVVVVAGILSTMDRERSTWEVVGGNLASYIFGGRDNSVMQILGLSYKHLPDHLKPCFLYFGEFQEDEEIHAGSLIRLWIAEGFIRQKGEKSAEIVAEECLMELIDKSLIMASKRKSDGRGVKTCVIHDLLRDLCLQKCEEEYFLKSVKNDIYSIYEKNQHVRSFYDHNMASPFYVRDMRLLRVLHFNCVRAHYIGIEILISLRYLVISDLPPSIGSLVNLEYLRVETYHETVYLPSAIMKMTKLRYLRVIPYARYGKDCNSSQTNYLEFLSNVIISKLEDKEMLKCSPHLRRLKCRCYPLLSEENGELQFADLRFLTQLDTLNIEFRGFKIQVTSFPSNIRKLTLSGSKLLDMSIIGKLENLEILKLGSEALAGERWDTRDGEFQNLIFLKFDSILLTQWNVASSDHFPKLQRLNLSNCYYLREIPSEIGEIATLQLIEVKGRCPKSMVDSAKEIQQQQLDMGIEDLRVIITI